MTSSTPRLPAEWEPQDGVLLAWPDHREIWEPELPVEQVLAGHLAIAGAIAKYETVIVVTAQVEEAAAALDSARIPADRWRVVPVPTNDCWIRDFGPITVLTADGPRLLDFAYNGWGLKFAADLDNQATRRLHAVGLFGEVPLATQGLVFEGGSIESDGAATLLTTAECLLSPNRNPHLDQAAIDERLRHLLGVERIIWLREGWLAGDDTDAHVDMLARFAPNDTILYTSCDDDEDEHAVPLARLRHELERLDRYRLLPLPIPAPCHGDDGHRLPASYANFLIVNGAVLVPTYADPRADERALATIAEAFPGRDIVGLDCRALIAQHGSLHCATMQLPRGCLSPLNRAEVPHG